MKKYLLVIDQGTTSSRTVLYDKKFEIKDTYDLIIHGATIASPTFYKKYPIETIKVNTILNLWIFI